MKICQKIFVALALFVTIQSTVAHYLSNCGLGPGTDACGQHQHSSFVVKAAKLNRPGRLVDPHMIHEVAVVKKMPRHYTCGSLHPTQQKPSGPTITDLLSPSCGPIAPRFRPIGDLCSKCKISTAEVIPAYPGRPPCSTCAHKAMMSESAISDPGHSRSAFTSVSHGNTELNSFDDDCLSFDEQENIYNSVGSAAIPADPVSLSLAYGLARNNNNNFRPVSEAGLAFGQKSPAIDGTVSRVAVNIPEEKLLTIERPLVELKVPRVHAVQNNYEDLIVQQELLDQKKMELKAQVETTDRPGVISYSELGYGPVTSTGNHFVSMEPQAEVVEEVVDIDDTPCGPLGPTIPGYQSGNLIIRTESPGPNEDDGQYDESSFEEVDSSASDSSEDADSYRGGSGFLSRLRVSARSQNKRKSCGCGH